MKWNKPVLYSMIAAQLLVWGWFSWKGGNLPKDEFLIFTVGMLLGQLGAGIETFRAKAWGTFVIQVYFFIFTAIGGIQRLLGGG